METKKGYSVVVPTPQGIRVTEILNKWQKKYLLNGSVKKLLRVKRLKISGGVGNGNGKEKCEWKGF